jgi:hypothetical protein
VPDDNDDDMIDVPPEAGDAWRSRGRAGGPGNLAVYHADPQRVFDLAYKGLRTTEIAAMLGVPREAIRTRYATQYRAGKGARREELRDQQWSLATADNGTPGKSAMLIFLGKNELGQRDRLDVQHGGTVQHEHRAMVARLMTDPAELAAAERHARAMLEAHGIDPAADDPFPPREMVEGEIVDPPPPANAGQARAPGARATRKPAKRRKPKAK